MTGISIEEYERNLRLADLLRGPALNAAVEGLRLGAGNRVLDAGCGTGSLLPALAGRVGPSGRVTGLDLSSGLLAAAEREMGKLGLGGQVSLVQGDVNGMPFDDGAFDCAISVDCVGCPYSRQVTSRESVEFILDDPYCYGFFVCACFSGTVS